MPNRLRVVIVKPSKYSPDGYVERFRKGFMPNGTIPYLRSMTPDKIGSCEIETQVIDEYVHTDLEYLQNLRQSSTPTLLALAGVQSHQFQRGIDLASYALKHGVEHCVIGGPHVMTCDTSMLHGRGVSFALSEAEGSWMRILRDAIDGELQPVYGQGQRWEKKIDAPVLIPPSSQYMKRYIMPMMGLYPARGCPFTCNFCSVIKIAGREIRSQDIEVSLASLRAAKAAGVKLIMFTSDNFNKYPDASNLLTGMIEEKINIPFFVQCDTQIVRQEPLIELLSKAGCFQIFVGVESFNRKILLAASKAQNHPKLYSEIVRLCRQYRIDTHFSNIIGFPEDTEAGVRQHLETLVELGPDIASFYILTPIPGTEQYDDFMADGRIFEKNLDRFDGTQPTWTHEHLSPEQRTRLLYRCYESFYSLSHLTKRIKRTIGNRKPGEFYGLMSGIAEAFITQGVARMAAFKQTHPMSGGVGRILNDRVQDYQKLRRERFGFDLLPLPLSLAAPDSSLTVDMSPVPQAVTA